MMARTYQQLEVVFSPFVNTPAKILLNKNFVCGQNLMKNGQVMAMGSARAKVGLFGP